MKIQIGNIIKTWLETPVYALNIEGFGILEFLPDVGDPPFDCIVLRKDQLIRLKKLIEKELDMKAKKVNPYNKREVKDNANAFAKTEKTVKPVAKDTNKTRRKMKKPVKKDC